MAVKKEETKVVAPKTEVKVEEVKAAAPKAAEKKVAAPKKAVEKKVEAAKAEVKKVVKAAAPKKAAEKKPAATKKAAAPKAAAKKTAAAVAVTLQFADKEYTQDDLAKIANDVWVYDYNKKASELKKVELFVKPEESKVYYVFNGDVTGSFDI